MVFGRWRLPYYEHDLLSFLTCGSLGLIAFLALGSTLLLSECLNNNLDGLIIMYKAVSISAAINWGVKKEKIWLRVVLVAGILLYLFSPLLDHWSGAESYARPHTHVHLADSHLVAPFHFSDEPAAAHAEHEELFLCLLDINAFFGIALIATGLVNPLIQKNLLIFGLPLPYLQIETIFLSSLDPPPRI